jgi:hypothetical protein
MSRIQIKRWSANFMRSMKRYCREWIALPTEPLSPNYCEFEAIGHQIVIIVVIVTGERILWIMYPTQGKLNFATVPREAVIAANIKRKPSPEGPAIH